MRLINKLICLRKACSQTVKRCTNAKFKKLRRTSLRLVCFVFAIPCDGDEWLLIGKIILEHFSEWKETVLNVTETVFHNLQLVQIS